MLFNSYIFILFLLIVFSIFWSVPDRWRWIVLLASSYIFYMYGGIKYGFLILSVTALSYSAGILLENKKLTVCRKPVLVAAVILLLGVLFVFKYLNFAYASIAKLIGLAGFECAPLFADIVLPVGISFYTFQSLSYVIDVYKGTVPAEHHFGKYAAFVSFFPQLVAGPIERTGALLPQIKRHHSFDSASAIDGLRLMLMGFYKKLVIADYISPYVSRIFDEPKGYTGFSLVMASILFTLQIYCDFSGYSDIAIGTARLFDVQLSKNFISPYFSESLKEFWSRWHISLSTWFRDYVYIPMGGNRVGKLRHSFNLLVTFLASGLWHGADWKFVVWGGVPRTGTDF